MRWFGYAIAVLVLTLIFDWWSRRAWPDGPARQHPRHRPRPDRNRHHHPALPALRHRPHHQRTLSCGGTLLLAFVFVAVIVVLTTIFESVTGANTVAVAASTLIVAALFQPLRRGIQQVVDRRFDRARYDEQRVIDSFARKLRDEVDLERMGVPAHDHGRSRASGQRIVWLRSGGQR
jgi:hypothetical protein